MASPPGPVFLGKILGNRSARKHFQHQNPRIIPRVGRPDPRNRTPVNFRTSENSLDLRNSPVLRRPGVAGPQGNRGGNSPPSPPSPPARGADLRNESRPRESLPFVMRGVQAGDAPWRSSPAQGGFEWRPPQDQKLLTKTRRQEGPRPEMSFQVQPGPAPLRAPGGDPTPNATSGARPAPPTEPRPAPPAGGAPHATRRPRRRPRRSQGVSCPSCPSCPSSCSSCSCSSSSSSSRRDACRPRWRPPNTPSPPRWTAEDTAATRGREG